MIITTNYDGLYFMSHAYRAIGWGRGVGGGGGLMQKRESPDFRFPGVGISAPSVVLWLMASRKVPMDIYVVVNFYVR